MPERAGRQDGGDPLRLADHAAAQAPAIALGEAGLQVAGLDRAHQLDGLGRQVLPAAERAAVEEHPAEAAVIPGRGEQTAVGGRVAVVRGGVVAVQNEDRRFFELAVRRFVGLRQAGDLLAGRVEGRILHAQRIEKPFLQELRERLPGDDLDDSPQRVDSGLAILPLRSGLELQRSFGVVRNQVGQRSGGLGLLRRGFAHARSVSQQVPERQLGRFSVGRLELGQFRQVLGHRIVHGKLALVLEHQHGRCRHRLGHRGDPEEVVRLASVSSPPASA